MLSLTNRPRIEARRAKRVKRVIRYPLPFPSPAPFEKFFQRRRKSWGEARFGGERGGIADHALRALLAPPPRNSENWRDVSDSTYR
jgi:hypothetical protein